MGSEAAYARDLKEDEFRLLSIEEIDGILLCHLSIHVREDAPEFIALSYAYNEPQSVQSKQDNDTQPEYQIILRGQEIPITPNLYYAFQQLCRKQLDTYWWIDQLCINQSNPEEVNEQVAAMHVIYRNALCVYVWLGADPLDHVYTVREFFRGLLAKYMDEDREEGFKVKRHWLRSFYKEVFDEAGIQTGPTVMIWLQVYQFWERSWFERAWVKQEVILAADHQIWCGRTEFTLAELVLASRFFGYSGLSDLLMHAKPESQTKSAIGRRVGTNMMGIEDDIVFLNYGHNVIEADDYRIGADRWTGPKTDSSHPLLRLFASKLFLIRREKATDPRDQVFTVLIMMKQVAENCDLPEIPIKINYCKSKAEVYAEAVRWVIEESRCLGMLGLLDPGRSMDAVQHGCSWVPDFSTVPTSCLRLFAEDSAHKTDIFWIDDQDRYAPSFVNDNLQINAKHLATVADTGDNGDTTFIHGYYENTARLFLNCPSVLPNGLSPIETWWMTMSGRVSPSIATRSLDYEDADITTSLDAFRRFLMFSIVARIAKEVKDIGIQNACEFMDTMPSLKLLAESERSGSKLLPNWSFWESLPLVDEELDKHLKPPGFHGVEYADRRIFRTEDNLIGLGPDAMQPGDGLWIVSGSTLPLLLRPSPTPAGLGRNSGEETMVVVGEAYVNGLVSTVQDNDLLQSKWKRLVLK